MATNSNPVTNPMFELAALHQTNVLGVDAMLANQTSTDPATIVKRPWIDEPSGSIPFDEQNGVALPNIGGSAVVLEYDVPIGFDGVIKFVSNNVTFGGFNQFSGDIIWQLLRNGAAIKNFSNIQAEKGTIQVPRPISPLRIYSGDVIQWVVTHAANGALNGQIICSLNGYIYPSKGVS